MPLKAKATGRTRLVNGVAEIDAGIEGFLGVSFKGVYRKNVNVQFYGPFQAWVSLANISTAMFSELAKALNDVVLHNYFSQGWADPSLKSQAFLNWNAPVGLFIGVPSFVPDRFFQHPFTIGGFVCETDEINPLWVPICNRMNLVIVPSTWCKDAFRKSGVVAPIMVVPHGLEKEYRPYKIKLHHHPFTFFNTFYSGSYCSRKSLDELVRCFSKAFGKRDDVVLRLRTDESPALNRCRLDQPFSDNILVEPISRCGTEEFARIYSDVHCTVHPSKGEGFGLIPFQSIACETPVIAIHKTGMADYLTDDNSIALNTKGRVAGEGMGNKYGTYFGIDEDHLIDCMETALENWDEEYLKLRQGAPKFREQNSWSAILGELTGIIESVLGTENLSHTKQRIRESYTLVTEASSQHP
jgi:glycosyltransferase involved in cell wall biosynthesis